MAQCYQLARSGVSFTGTACFSKACLIPHDVFAQEKETPRREVSLRSFDVAHGSRGGDCGEGGMFFRPNVRIASGRGM